MVKFFTSSLLILTLFLLLPGVSFSQTSSIPFGRNISLRISPQIPAPEETVTLYAESLLVDLGRSTITWSLNGTVELRGVAERQFTFTAPRAGERSIITTTVSTPGGQNFVNTYTFEPSNVDLLIEADTYTPPLYPGRSLFTHQSTLTAVAIPDLRENGSRISPQNILYTWERDGTVLQNLSGQGKNLARFEGSIISRPFTISVTAENLSGTSKSKKTIAINPADPQLLVYENNPLFGNVFEKALSKPFDLEREEVSVMAIPYFFAVNTKNSGDLRYSWLENNKTLDFQIPSADLTITNKERMQNGISTFEVRANHTKKMLQSATIKFTLNVIGGNLLNQQTPIRNATIF